MKALTIVIAALAVCFLTSSTPAVPLYWDPAHAGGTGSGGSGAWDDSAANWWNGSTWVATTTSSDDLIIGGSAGTITTSGANKNANTLTFNSNYTTAGSYYITVAGKLVTVNSGATVTASGAARFVGSSMKKDGAGVLNWNATALFGYGGGARVTDGTLNLNGLGLCGNYDAASFITNALVVANVNDPLYFTAGFANHTVAAGGVMDFNGRTQGNITGVSDSPLRRLTINGGGVLGGGGNVAMQGHVNNNFTLGLSLSNGGTFDTENGTLGIFSSPSDEMTVWLSSGSGLATGSGKLILGQGSGTDTGFGVSISGTGGSTISGKIDLTNSRNSGAKSRTISVADGAEAVDFTISALIADGAQAGSGITKTGSGTLLLSGLNTYTGPTTISAGTLKLSGSLATSKITVDGALTGGSGTITFTTGDVIDVNGSMDLNGMFFDLDGLPLANTTLVDYSGGGSILNFAGLTRSSPANWVVVNDTVNSLILANLNAIPEPSIILLLGCGAFLASRARRRSR